MENPNDASLLDSDSIQGPMGQNGDAAPEQILDSELFRQLPSTPVESGGETSGVGKASSLAFHAYKEHQNLTPYAARASI